AEGEEPAPLPVPDAEGKVHVAWQHQGVGLNDKSPAYKSVRVNRRDDPMELTNSAARYIHNEDYKDHRFRLRAKVRAQVAEDGNGSGGRLFIQVLNARFETYIDEDLRDQLATEPVWREVELTGAFTEGTRFITYGVSLAGLGEACFDDVRFAVAKEDDVWRELEVQNSGFEQTEGGVPRSWDFDGYGYRFTSSDKEPFTGKRSLCIRSFEDYVPGSLFAGLPSIGAEADKALGAGLRVRFPLALWLKPEPSKETSEALAKLLVELEAIDLEAARGDDPEVRIASVTIAWNIFQHFYPYFDVVAVDWDEVLAEALSEAVGDHTAQDFLATLRRLVARLEDGHGGVFHPDFRSAFLDAEFLQVEEQLVIVEFGDAPGLTVGDVVETVDGVAAAEVVEAHAATFSGSPQWRRHRALTSLAPGTEGTLVELGIRRGDRRLTVEVPRVLPSPRTDEQLALRRLAEGVWYVDLSRASMAEIDELIAELAAAHGVVFDLRGYPNGNHDVLRHLTLKPLRSAKWNVPQIVYPDRERLVGYNTSGRWTLDPKQPRFQGKAIFVTDGRAISYAESLLGIVEHYRLGEIVGEPTAGTNGNLNWMVLPGRYRVNWTGMKVIKHDDSQHHLVGVLPDVPARRTVAGVRAGRDELLEKALALIQD
ncbi:MAG: S41 family peptidase, partial [Thermoanaerobaculia bacterium]